MILLKETCRSIFFIISFAEIIKIKVKYFYIGISLAFVFATTCKKEPMHRWTPAHFCYLHRLVLSFILVLLISQFNGLDVIIQRIDETLRRGLPSKADDKSATTDILESSIATLRILAKGMGRINFLANLNIFWDILMIYCWLQRTDCNCIEPCVD